MLRARWLLASLLTVPVLIVTTLFAVGLEPAFRSVAVVTFSPVAQGVPDNGFLRLLPRYAYTATAPQTLRAAEQTAGLTSGSLSDSVTAELPRGTVELTLTVTTSAPKSSVAAAQSLARSVLGAVDSDPSVSARVVQEPRQAADSAPRKRLVALVVGWVLAAMLAATSVIAIESLRPRVRLPEDLVRPGVPVLKPLPGRRGRLVGFRATASEGTEVTSSSFGTLTFALARRAATGSGSDRRPALVVTSVEESVAEVEQVALELKRWQATSLGRDSQEMSEVIAGPPIFPTEGSTIEALSGRVCVLVVHAGTPRDRMDQCVVLLDTLDAPLLGTVLIL